jgi:hypothetical protein
VLDDLAAAAGVERALTWRRAGARKAARRGALRIAVENMLQGLSVRL